MTDNIFYLLEYIQAIIDLQQNERDGLALWLVEIYDALDEGRLSDALQLIRGVKRMELSAWGKAQVFLGQGDFHYDLKNWDEALVMYQDALAWFQKADSSADEQAVVQNNLGLVYQEQGRYEDAIRCFEMTIEAYQQLGDLQTKIHTISNLASVYDERGDWQKAIQYYKLGIELLSQGEDQDTLPRLLNNVGVVYQKAGQLSQAAETFQKCVDLLDEAGLSHSATAVRVLMNLMDVHAANDQASQAIHCGELAAQVSQELSDSDLESSAWNNLGAFYASRQDFSNALKSYTRSLELANRFSNRDAQALALNNLGAIYIDTGEFEKAEELYTQSLALSADLSDLYGIARAHNNLGVLFEKSKNYPKAVWHYQQAGAGLHEIADFYRETTLAINIASLYARLDDSANAWEWYEHGRQLAERYGYADLFVSLEILNGDLKFRNPILLQEACEAYSRACQYALQAGSQFLQKFIEIARKRLAWLKTEDRPSLCQAILARCHEDLQSGAPEFCEYLITGGVEDGTR